MPAIGKEPSTKLALESNLTIRPPVHTLVSSTLRVPPEAVTKANLEDQTLEGGLRRAERHMTESEIKQYMNGDWRIRIIK